METQQVISITIAVAALTLAVIVAVKMPKAAWFKAKSESNNSNEDWAPEYSFKEKLKLFGIHACWLLPLFILIKYLSRSLKGQAVFCGEYLGVSHMSWSLAGLMTIMVVLILGNTGYLFYYWHKVYRHQQFPLPGQKVWKPQRMIKGQAAQRRAKWMMLGLSVLGIGFLISMVMLFILIMGFVTPEALIAKCASFTTG